MDAHTDQDGNRRAVQRREYFRLPMHMEEVSIHPVEDDGRPGPARRAKLWDLSGGGAALMHPTPLPRHAVVMVTVPTGRHESMTVRARVLESMPLGAHRWDRMRYRVRLQFVDVKEPARAKIIADIYRREVERRAVYLDSPESTATLS